MEGTAAIELLFTLRPDLLVIGVGTPDRNGIEATRRRRSELGFVVFLALSTHTDRRHVQSMLDAGGSDYGFEIEACAEL